MAAKKKAKRLTTKALASRAIRKSIEAKTTVHWGPGAHARQRELQRDARAARKALMDRLGDR